MSFTKEVCEQWLINREKEPLINPITNRKITRGKGVFIELEKACFKMTKSLVKSRSKSPVKSRSCEKLRTYCSNTCKNIPTTTLKHTRPTEEITLALQALELNGSDDLRSEQTATAERDRFLFYSGSKDTYPGEQVAGRKQQEFVNNPNDYKKLSKIKDWRKILSNFHVCPFKYTTWYGTEVMFNSIEHGFQSEKIALEDKTKAYSFTLNSDSSLGSSDGATAQKHRKMVMLSDSNIKKWGVMSQDIMESLAKAKYKQCKDAAEVLKMTGNAELWHVVMRKGITRFDHLERIRKSL